MRLLFPLLRKLEPEIDHEHRAEKFRPHDLTLIRPYDSKEFVSEVLERYSRSIFYIALIICSFTFVLLKLAWIPVSYIVPISGHFRALIYLGLSWLLFMLLFTIYALVKPVGERRATWRFEYKLILHGVGQENKIERLITALEQEIAEPDERIEHYRNQAQKRSFELQNLFNDLAISDKKARQIKMLMKKNPEMIREILLANRTIANDERETLKELLEPKSILRDIGINLISNGVASVVSCLAGLTIGFRSQN